MTKTYHARLSLEATVPEDLTIEPFLKASVEFAIWCPKCGPFRHYLKKNGFDTNHSARPQLFFCKRHQIHFYAHTSWIFTQLSEIVFERIISDLFEKQLPAKAVATIHRISPSLISQIRHYFTQALNWKLALLAHKRELLRLHPKLPVPLEDAIYWDETFFRIGHTSWALILLIDAHGRPLAWKFSQKRDMTVYRELIKTILSHLPSIPIFIGDGWNAYQKTCLELAQTCFLIEHLHSHPWRFVRLHQFQFNPKTKTTIQNSLEIPYNSFTRNQPLTGHAFQRKHPVKDSVAPSKKRGRPLGVKDKQKRHSKHFPKPPVPKRQLKKRGRKSIRQNGRRFHFHPHPVPVGWQIEWVEVGSEPPQLPTPTILEIELLLDLTYKVMNGKSIQSNRIESKNRMIKDITPKRGFKNPNQLNQYLDTHLRFWSNTIDLPNLKIPPVLPLKPLTGFARLFSFFQPRIEAIQIRTHC